MPPIYRQIVPNIPALTVGNGKPCYRGNAPSYQRLMQYSISWLGNVPNAGDKQISRTEAEMNSLINTPNAYTTIYDTRYYSSTPGFPSTDPSNYQDQLGHEWYYKGLFLRANGEGYTTLSMNIMVGLEWDAGLSYWQWFAVVYNFLAWDDPQTSMSLDGPNGSTASAVFRAQASDSTLRVGNGIAMPFSAVQGSPFSNHPDFHNCSVVISAQYA